jgi:hypothetical protein
MPGQVRPYLCMTLGLRGYAKVLYCKQYPSGTKYNLALYRNKIAKFIIDPKLGLENRQCNYFIFAVTVKIVFSFVRNKMRCWQTQTASVTV